MMPLLALIGYVLLLACTLASMLISWRVLRNNDSLQLKIDWLRTTLGKRDASIRSYESVGHDEQSQADWKDTTVMPPPLPDVPPPPPRRKR